MSTRLHRWKTVKWTLALACALLPLIAAISAGCGGGGGGNKPNVGVPGTLRPPPTIAQMASGTWEGKSTLYWVAADAGSSPDELGIGDGSTDPATGEYWTRTDSGYFKSVRDRPWTIRLNIAPDSGAFTATLRDEKTGEEGTISSVLPPVRAYIIDMYGAVVPPDYTGWGWFNRLVSEAEIPDIPLVLSSGTYQVKASFFVEFDSDSKQSEKPMSGTTMYANETVLVRRLSLKLSAYDRGDAAAGVPPKPAFNLDFGFTPLTSLALDSSSSAFYGR